MGDLKMKQEAAMEGGNLNLKMEAVLIGDRDLKTKTKDNGVSPPEGGDTLKSKTNHQSSGPWEEGRIPRLKKETFAAWDHWLGTKSPAIKARNEKRKAEKAQALIAGKKKMKVVKTRLSRELIHHMAQCPFTVCSEIPEEVLARCPPIYCEAYANSKLFQAKTREYWNALVTQQEELGYAEDEIEVVTDDDEDEEMVEN